ncbi:MAG: carbohydrate ABC transporter permease [Acidimicrobiia bacterium]|nr:carbohydrate ABC transporter permease [Acidimicrobiia bacterium]
MRRSSRLRASIAAYGVLLLFAAIMLFPFVFMAATALKTPEDTFRYPPRILPRTQDSVTIEGEEQDLYAIELPSGDTASMYIAESGVTAGLFVEPDDPEQSVAWPLELATDTGATVDVAGTVLPVYDVTIGDNVRELALERETAVARFVDPGDEDQVAYAVARTAERAERVEFQWQNFTDIVELRDIDRALTNTILVTVLVVGGTLFTSIMGGFAFSRVRFPGRDKIFVAYIGSIMIPFIVLIVPLFRLMVELGWVDTLGSLVWPFLFNAYGTFLMRQFFSTIPGELEEAAFIDGASRWTILWRLYVPLSWPAIATLATFMFLYAWNSFIWPLVSINLGNSDDFVLTLALQTLNGQAGEGPNLLFAAIVISVMIPFTVFILAQRYFVENAASSGIK